MITKRYKRIPGISLRFAEAVTVMEKKHSAKELPIIEKSLDVKDFMFEHEYYNETNLYTREIFYAVFINRRNRILAVEQICIGSSHQTIVDIHQIFSTALNLKALGLIVIHNHPSGEKKPSEPDKRITAKIKKAGDILEIKLLDSVIIAGQDSYFSFADEGIL